MKRSVLNRQVYVITGERKEGVVYCHLGLAAGDFFRSTLIATVVICNFGRNQ